MDMEALVDIVQDVKLPTEVPVSLQLAVIAHMNTIYENAAVPDCRRTDNHPVIELTDVEEVRPWWLSRPPMVVRMMLSMA